MARLNKKQVSERILGQITEARNILNHLTSLPLTQLETRPAPDAWNALQCVDHLNTTYDIYLTNMLTLKPIPSDKLDYRTTAIGKKAYTALLPSEDGQIKMKMKTFKELSPSKELTPVFDTYHETLQRLEKLVKDSLEWDWDRMKVPSALGSLIKFKLGDAFQFMLAHDLRHLLQAQRATGIK